MDVNHCLICLRTDRKLKTCSILLSEYHDELCDFNVDSADPLYCAECEHQLRKHYNFRNKCQRAAIILQKWEKNYKHNPKTPVESLHKLLPSSSCLSLSTADNAKVFECFHEKDEEPKPYLLIVDGLIITTNNGENNTNSTLQVDNVTVSTRSRSKKKNTDVTSNTTHTQQNNEVDGQHEIEIKNSEVKNNAFDLDFSNNFDVSHADFEFDDINDTEDRSEPINESPVVLDDSYDVKKEEVTIRKRSHSEEDSIYKEDGDSQQGNVKRKRIRKIPAKKKSNNLPSKKKANKEKVKYQMLQEPVENKLTSKTIVKKIIEKDTLTFEAERLKTELTTRFASCGDLVASDGTAIDKEYMMDCLYRKMKEPTMELLWTRIRGKSTFTPKTIKMLAFLQNRYRRLDKYEDVFDIEYFNTMDKVREEFENRKYYPAFMNADYKCLICYQKLISEKCLERHARWHNESSGRFVCEVCQYRYPTDERLKHHFACSHQAVFKCKMCSYVTYNSENMDGHYSKHMNLKATCDICKKTLANKAMLKIHIRVRHSPVTPKQKICNQCGKAFCLQWFRRHLLKHHGVTGGVNPPVDGLGVPCDTCEITFPSQTIYQAHMKHVHQEKTNEPVTRIRKKRGEGKPKAPNGTKSEKKPNRVGRPLGFNGEWTCRVCSKTGKTWGKLMIHFEFDHPDVDMTSIYADTTATLCEICGKGLSNVYSLRDHMRIHTGDRPFACDMCPKRFARAIGLQGHRLTHFPKSKPCPYCGKMFRQTGNLLNHMRIHVNDRKYKCKVCGKGFLHRQAMKEHFNGVHLHVRRVKRPARKIVEADRGQIIEDEIVYTGSSEYE